MSVREIDAPHEEYFDGHQIESVVAAGTRPAVMGSVHLGDIQGALGTVRQHNTAPRRSWRARLLTLLAIMGPGLIVMVGKFWGAFSVGDLFILNFLTLVTEFIGVSLAMSYFGISPWLSVPTAAVALIAISITGSFRRWERFLFAFILVNLVVIPLTLMVHPDLQVVVHDSVVPAVRGGLDGTALLLIISIVGTTVAPWQLFFQQSRVS